MLVLVRFVLGALSSVALTDASACASCVDEGKRWCPESWRCDDAHCADAVTSRRKCQADAERPLLSPGVLVSFVDDAPAFEHFYRVGATATRDEERTATRPARAAARAAGSGSEAAGSGAASAAARDGRVLGAVHRAYYALERYTVWNGTFEAKSSDGSLRYFKAAELRIESDDAIGDAVVARKRTKNGGPSQKSFPAVIVATPSVDEVTLSYASGLKDTVPRAWLVADDEL